MRETLTPVIESGICGAWGGCPLPKGHNMGKPDIPENHAHPTRATVRRPYRIKVCDHCGGQGIVYERAASW